MKVLPQGIVLQENNFSDNKEDLYQGKQGRKKTKYWPPRMCKKQKITM